MKKIKNRALFALVLVFAVIAGLIVYTVGYIVNGSKWAAFAANSSAYSKGILSVGTLTDRNGVVLAGVSEGSRTFAEEADVRKSTLHAVGDTTGNIGTGALTVFASELMGYNLITGSYSRTGEGETIALSIDSKLNTAAYKALAGKKGAVGVLNYETGEMLCMVSAPAYDPKNPPVVSEGDPEYEGVYLNRVLSAAYTPGSTFKLVTAAAALEHISGIDERVFECSGTLEISGGKVTCSKVHGKLKLDDALAVSCNIAFAELALELGAETIAAYAEKYGLLNRNSINGISTAKGSFTKASADTAELAWSGVGQADNMVCPAAMLRFIAAIANGGAAPEITLLKRTGLKALTQRLPQKEIIIKPETAERLGLMMNYNVEHSYGKEKFPGLEIFAKSGTAEVGVDREPHSWFTGYIKNEGYPLAFVVVVENGGGGSAVAGAAANEVLQAAVAS